MLDFLRKIYKKRGGIWKYADFYAEKIEEGNRLMLGDGGTELLENKDITESFNTKCSTHPASVASDTSYPSLEGNNAIQNTCLSEHLYFKREDRNECGSLKGRSLAYQVSLNKQRGAEALVISTSGNAGIAAAAYAQKAGMKLFVFISPDTEEGKVADMQKYDPIIIKSPRAMRFANYVAAKYKLPNLRPSIDDDSIEGFKSIAFEIADEAGDVDAIFTFVTSGSSFVGMYRGFEAYANLGEIKKIPKMYAVQSGEIFSIAEEFEDNSCLIEKENYEKSEYEILTLTPALSLKGEGGMQDSLQNGEREINGEKEMSSEEKINGENGIKDGLQSGEEGMQNQDADVSMGGWGIMAGKFGVKNTQRKKEILDIIEKTDGKGIYVSEREIEKARKILVEHKIETSLEGCASFAGFIKMRNAINIHPRSNHLPQTPSPNIGLGDTIQFKKAVCILSGKLRSGQNKIDESKMYKAESFEDVDRIVEMNMK